MQAQLPAPAVSYIYFAFQAMHKHPANANKLTFSNASGVAAFFDLNEANEPATSMDMPSGPLDVDAQIEGYLQLQQEPKLSDMTALHKHFFNLLPDARRWFLDGRDDSGKVVSNPTIGYGHYTISYANGGTKDFFRVGLSGNTKGISVYIMGLADKTYLPRTLGQCIGKAKVTGYCIAFKRLADIHLPKLDEAIRYATAEEQ